MEILSVGQSVRHWFCNLKKKGLSNMTKFILLDSLLQEVTAIVRLPNPKLSTVVWLPNLELNFVVRLPNQIRVPKFSSVVGLPNRKMTIIVRLPNPKMSTAVWLPNPKLSTLATFRDLLFILRSIQNCK